MKVLSEDHVFFEMKDAIKYWENYISSLDTESGSSEKSTGKQDAENLLNDDAVAKEEKANQIVAVNDTEYAENEVEPDADDKSNENEGDDNSGSNGRTEDATNETQENGYVE